MSFPRPKYYTVDQLAEEWRVSVWKVNDLVDTGQLVKSEIFFSKESKSDVFNDLDLPPEEWSEANEDEMSYQELHDDLCEVLTDGEKQYYIKLEEVERFEKDHGLTVGGDQEEPGGHSHQKNEKFPGIPNEQPLYGMPDIARHIGKTPDYLLHVWKKQGCPINKDHNNFGTYAYPSQLDAWRSSKTKK